MLSNVLVALMISALCQNVASSDIPSNDIPEARLVSMLTPVGRILVRPTKDRTPTAVTIQFMPVHIVELNMAKQELHIAASFIMSWNDPFLRWNPTDYAGIAFTRIPVSSLWIPEFALPTNMAGKVDMSELKKETLVVTYDGNVTWNPGDIFRVKCEVEAAHFPFDEQRCNIPVVLPRCNTQEATLTGMNFTGPGAYMENLEWALIGQDVQNLEYVTGVANVNYSNVVFTLILERSPAYYGLNIILPIALLHVVGLMVFILPAESGEKVSLSMSCLISFFLTQLTIAQEIPRSWKSIPFILIFNFTFVCLNGLSVLVAVLAVSLQNRTTEVPACLEGIFHCKWKNYKKCARPNISRDGQIRKARESLEAALATNGSENAASTNSLKTQWSDLSSLLGIHNLLSEHMEKIEHGDVLKQKWKDVGNVVNNCLCVIYILAGIFLCTVCAVMWLTLARKHNNATIL